MKYKTAQEMAAGLRWLADFVEEQGVELPSDYGYCDPQIFLSISAKTKEKMAQAAKALASQGIVKKSFDYDARLIKNFGNHVQVRISCDREKVCTRVVTGTKEVEESLYVKTGRMVTEEVVEWVCDPILAD